MAQIVAAALVSHGPLVTGRPEVSKPEQRERCMPASSSFAAVPGYELSAAERTALKDGDITGLYHLGANPFLIRRVFRAR